MTVKKKVLSGIAIFVAAAVLITLSIMFIPNKKTKSSALEYQEKLFDKSNIMQVDITCDGDDWQTMLDNAQNEEFISVDVTVNGQTVNNVGIRPKGNSSLTQIVNSDSDRYSFKIKFDKYVDGQNCYGLDKLVLNNITSDNTYIKEYLAYDMMNYMNVDCPLYSFAKITVNGEYWGLYFALESYDDSFLERTYGSDEGNLYNVKSVNAGGGGNMGDKQMPDNMETDESGNPVMPQQSDMSEPATTSVSENSAQTTVAEDSKTTSANNEQTQQENNSNNSQPVTTIDGQQPSGNDGQPPEMPNGQQPSGNDGQPPEMPNGQQPSENAQPQSNVVVEETTTTAIEAQVSNSETQISKNTSSSETQSTNQNGFGGDMSQMRGDKGNFGGGGMGGNNGGSLEYTDDNSSSYSSIFDNAVFNSSDEEDFQRVITALKNLSEGENLEQYFDVDQILRYFAVHTFLVNLDSYYSNMQQNYYLYENNGKVTILPWDYNLAFGGFQSGSASSAVNAPIDTPVSGVEMEERPLLNQLLSVDEYNTKYHEYLSQLTSEYIDSGHYEEVISEVTALIDSDVKSDPSAFCTYDEYTAGVETLKEFCKLRAESVEGQLNGTIPSTTQGQTDDSSSLIDVGDMNLSTMGSQGGNKGGFGGGGDRGGFGNGQQSITTDAYGNMQLPNGETATTDESGNIQLPNGETITTDENGNANMPNKGGQRPDGQNGQMQPPDMQNGGQKQMPTETTTADSNSIPSI